MIKKCIVVLLCALSVLLCGCGASTPASVTGDESHFVPVTAENGEIYFKDFDGVVIEMDEEPKRIVSLSVVASEIICGIGASRYMKAIDKESALLPDAPVTAEVLDEDSQRPDNILSYEPDIVFYSSGDIPEETAIALREMGVITVRIPAEGSISTAEANIRFISALLHRDSQGEQVISDMRAEINKIKLAADIVSLRKKVYIEYGDEYKAVCSSTIISELCSYAGADNIYASFNGIVPTTVNSVVEKNPDVIIVLSEDPENYKTDKFSRRKGVSAISAVKTKSVYCIDLKTATRPTQNLVLIIKDLGKIFKIMGN